MSSLWENSRIRDNNCFYNSKTLSVFFYALRFGHGESTFLGSESRTTCTKNTSLHTVLVKFELMNL